VVASVTTAAEDIRGNDNAPKGIIIYRTAAATSGTKGTGKAIHLVGRAANLAVGEIRQNSVGRLLGIMSTGSWRPSHAFISEKSTSQSRYLHL
jgi:hypothetical protein